jgi:hypothetical protein
MLTKLANLLAQASLHGHPIIQQEITAFFVLFIGLVLLSGQCNASVAGISRDGKSHDNLIIWFSLFPVLHDSVPIRLPTNIIFY